MGKHLWFLGKFLWEIFPFFGNVFIFHFVICLFKLYLNSNKDHFGFISVKAFIFQIKRIPLEIKNIEKRFYGL
jgi:hypothetical protein